MDFSRYNNNLNDLKKYIEAAEENSKKFEEIIPGTYEISIESLAVKETKSGDSLMLSTCMKILDGKYKNRLIFFNQLLMTGFGIHKANEFLSIVFCLVYDWNSWWMDMRIVDIA